jgi:sulfatase maturation enzyme AslB (radical SAM superfamily)
MRDEGMPRLRGAVLVVTSACNLKCTYCLQDRHPARRMSEQTADEVLDRLLRSRQRKLAIGFYGGEPLLAFDLVRRTVEQAERRRPRGSRLLLSLSTNGLLLDPEKAAFLAARVETQVSFDGSPAAQELRAPGTFGLLSDRLEELRRLCPAFYESLLEVAITVTPDNLHTLAESVGLLLERRVQRITLGPVLGGSVKWEGWRERELDGQLRHAYRRCRSVYDRTGRVPLTLFRRTPGRPLAKEGGAMCGAGRGGSITVDVDGEISACPLLARSYQTFSAPGLRRWVEPLRIGSLEAPDLGGRLDRFRAEVRRSPLFMQRERKRTARRRCADCRYRASCRVCPVAIAHAGDDPHLVPEFLCAFNRLTLKYGALPTPVRPPGLTNRPPRHRFVPRAPRRMVLPKRAPRAGEATICGVISIVSMPKGPAVASLT